MSVGVAEFDVVIPWLRPHASFPPIDTALSDPNGLLAASADLSPDRLVEAYRHGIFPWSAQGAPVLWWSPDPRMVLFVDEFHRRRSLAKVVRAHRFEIRVDTAFRDVMAGCANAPRPGQYGTWITPGVIDAYCALHARGLAHSVEAWRQGELVGGLYGVAIGRMFFGESMFARETDASKVALVHLVAALRQRRMPMIDCQQDTPHLATFGARAIPRREFAERLAALIHSDDASGPWSPPAHAGVPL
jgi:leucyl/phenylalanyl-tRNA--protein transferase